MKPRRSTYVLLGVVTLKAPYEHLIELGCNVILECNIHDVTFEKPRYIGPGRTVMHASVQDCSASVLSMAAVTAERQEQDFTE